MSRIDQLQREERIAGGLKGGETYAIVSAKWFAEWRRWSGTGADDTNVNNHGTDGCTTDGTTDSEGRPGEIDNRCLLEPTSITGALRKDINECQEFEIVSMEVWDLLHSWYSGGPAIRRRALSGPNGRVTVELYGLELKVHRSSNLNAGAVHVTESKSTTVRAFKARMCAEFSLSESDVRLWDYFNQRKYENLENSADRSLDACRIFAGNAILIEERDADGTFPDDGTSTYNSNGGGGTTSYGSYGNSGGSTLDVASHGRSPQTGAVGLQNLGNTCFMNSALQCLSNVQPLREYFLTGGFEAEINSTAYKTKGELAKSYAALLKQIWDQGVTSVAPRNFKYQIGQFAEQFSGYGQQDSMELVEYVLDGLKEDLNKIRGPKPYIEVSEADGRPDDVVAQEAFDSYQRRNASFIDDLFVGFYKSTVRCPVAGCTRESVTMDPFFSVKLPLNSDGGERMHTFAVTVVGRLAGGAPTRRLNITSSRDGSGADLVAATVRAAGIEDPRHCLLVELWSKKVHKVFTDEESVRSVRNGDTLLLYEVAAPSLFRASSSGYTSSGFAAERAPAERGAEELSAVTMYHRQSRASASRFSSASYASPKEHVSLPWLFCLPRRVASAREFIEHVGRELIAALGEAACPSPGSWKLFIVDRWSAYSDGTLLDPANEDVVHMGPRQELVIEWAEGVEVPPVLEESLQLALQDTSDGMDGAPSGPDLPLERCFEMFTEEEQLSSSDSWYCNRCRDHVEAYKHLQFYKLPPVLVVQLKRFSYTRYSRERLDTAVRFPLSGLNLSPCCVAGSQAASGCHIYDLCAVSKHIGALGGGHYVAYARSSVDGAWYYFDDGSVQRVGAERVAADKVGAYVLFYVRRDRRPSVWRDDDGGEVTGVV